ncbi:hypothetical protein [Lacinutrix sp.]|uniref:hypothetical protein n=1 Tax=Lacinutrix sp. TaxID=1937692 RepID=UPI0025C0FB53|nr:hypothetical protein [Lacinutrix sp.]
MSIFSKEDKNMLATKGIDGGIKLLEGFIESSKLRQEQALVDNVVTKEEYNLLAEEKAEYEEMIHNLLSDTELNSKFRKTEEIFVSIIRIIMFDLEFDYSEVFKNLNQFIDNEKFFEGHEKALNLRKERIEREYQIELENYENEIIVYKERVKEQKSKGFFKRLISEEIPLPVKPEKRD